MQFKLAPTTGAEDVADYDKTNASHYYEQRNDYKYIGVRIERL